MGGLSAAQILFVWERGQGLSLGQQALLLLRAGSGKTDSDRLTRMTIGERDEELCALRAQTFGPSLDGIAECPACAENLEVKINLAELGGGSPADASKTRSLSRGEYEVSFRLPTASDIASLAPGTDPVVARQSLLRG